MTDPLPPSIRPLFRAVAEGCLAPTRAYDEGDWTRAEAVVVDALRDRPPAMVRQLQLFLRLVNLLPLVTRGRTLRRLPPEERGAFLARLQDARLLPIRRGIWGLRTLAFMGHYARPEVQLRIGYRARLRGRLEHPDAWEAGDGPSGSQAARDLSESGDP